VFERFRLPDPLVAVALDVGDQRVDALEDRPSETCWGETRLGRVGLGGLRLDGAEGVAGRDDLSGPPAPVVKSLEPVAPGA
jgi:hypothetical protein